MTAQSVAPRRHYGPKFLYLWRNAKKRRNALLAGAVLLLSLREADDLVEAGGLGQAFEEFIKLPSIDACPYSLIGWCNTASIETFKKIESDDKVTLVAQGNRLDRAKAELEPDTLGELRER